jgi:hypothetical protein
LKTTIFYPDLFVNAPETDYHGLGVQVSGGWSVFESKLAENTIIDCRVVKTNGKHPIGKRVWPQLRFLTINPPKTLV